MELICPAWLILLLGGSGLLFTLLVGVVVLLKIGVIADYATREEAPESGDYSLEQSREPSDS
ncbi:MAG: hypothetical protein PVG11_06955 [Anaerolineae bacterium]|jgi:hypothetical protein